MDGGAGGRTEHAACRGSKLYSLKPMRTEQRFPTSLSNGLSIYCLCGLAQRPKRTRATTLILALLKPLQVGESIARDAVILE